MRNARVPQKKDCGAVADCANLADHVFGLDRCEMVLPYGVVPNYRRGKTAGGEVGACERCAGGRRDVVPEFAGSLRWRSNAARRLLSCEPRGVEEAEDGREEDFACCA